MSLQVTLQVCGLSQPWRENIRIEVSSYDQALIVRDKRGQGFGKFIKKSCLRSSIYDGDQHSVGCMLKLGYEVFRLVFKLVSVRGPRNCD